MKKCIAGLWPIKPTRKGLVTFSVDYCGDEGIVTVVQNVPACSALKAVQAALAKKQTVVLTAPDGTMVAYDTDTDSETEKKIKKEYPYYMTPKQDGYAIKAFPWEADRKRG
jgi:hypothetical protein